MKEAKYFLAKGVIDLQNQVTSVLVANFSATPCHFPAGSKIASFEPFLSGEWIERSETDGTNEQQADGIEEVISDPSLAAERIETTYKLPLVLDISKANITSEQKVKLADLIMEFKDCFNENPDRPGTADGVVHSIDIQGAQPIYQFPYHAGPKERQVIDSQN